MKSSIFFSFLIFASLCCNAQVERNGLQSNDPINLTLNFEQAEIPFTNFFSGARVIDARDDTSAIGYYSIAAKENIRPRLYRILPSTKDGVTKWITSYLGISQKNASSSATLLIVIKKLWLSSKAKPKINENGKILQPKELGFDPGLVSKLEFYLEKDSSFYPLYKIDSIFTYGKDLHKYADSYVTESLKKMLNKLYRINFSEVLNRASKLSVGEMVAYNSKTAAVQILNTTGYKKGVYKSFVEFKKNEPSIANFELKAGKAGDMLYVTENGSEYPIRNAWGFCDGTDLYVNSCDKYSKLIKCQNTFYFAGIKGIERESIHDLFYTSLLTLATDTGRKHTKYRTTIKYYKVDMETGEVY